MLFLKVDFSNKLNCKYSIYASFKYNPDYVNIIKSLSNRIFDANTKQWEIDYEKCYSELISLINTNNIAFNCKEFMQSINDLQDKVKNMQSLQNQDRIKNLDNIVFKTQPFSYQKEGILFGLNNDRFLLADQPGLGKTLMSVNIARLRQGGKHCLIVVGYQSLLFNWVKEIQTHTELTGYVLGQRRKKRNNRLYIGSIEDRLYDLQHLEDIEDFFIITDITTLRQCRKQEYINKKGKKAFNKDFYFASLIEQHCRNGIIGRIILDESHVFKNYDADQTQALLKIKNCPYKIAMTGTPIMNRNIDLYPVMNWLGYEDKNYWEFTRRYCKFGGFNGKQIIGNQNNNELHNKLSTFMLRRLKSDVLDLPEKIFIDEYLEMDGKQWSLYEKVKLMSKADIAKMKHNKSALLLQLTNLRKITCHPAWYDENNRDFPSVKYERILQILEQAVENNQKTIIFSCYTTPMDSTIECMNLSLLLKQYNPAIITGDTKDRMSQVDKFQNDDDCKIIIGSIGAMGVGLTLNKASNEIFLDEPWNRAIKEQAIDRGHRVGTKNNINIYTLMCKGTVDEGVHKTVYTKGRLADEIVDGVSEEELVQILTQDYE